MDCSDIPKRYSLPHGVPRGSDAMETDVKIKPEQQRKWKRMRKQKCKTPRSQRNSFK